MEIKKENIDELNGTITVSIEKSDYEPKVEEQLKEYRKKANVPGFRPGKVPTGLVKKMYGKAIVVDEVNRLLSSELSKYIVGEKLNILGEPLPNDEKTKEIDWDTDENFEFTFDIGFAPEVDVKLDKRSKYPYYEISVSEEMIDEQVDGYANRFGQNEAAEVVEENESIRANIVQVDEAGIVIEDGISAEMALMSVQVIKDEEIKAMFAGKKIDDEVVCDLKKAYPSDAELSYILSIEKEAAADVEGLFKVTIKEINQFVAHEVNEELIKKVFGEESEIKDIPEFRNAIVDQIKEGYAASSDYKFSLDTRDKLIDKTTIELPEAFLKRWLQATNKEITEEQIEKDFDAFTKDLKWQLIKEKLTKENEIEVKEEEVIELAKEVAGAQFRQYGMFDVPAEHLDGFAQQMLEKEDDRNRLYNKKVEDKVVAAIKEKVNIDTKSVSKEEFDKLFE